jgi:hypothetical protein
MRRDMSRFDECRVYSLHGCSDEEEGVSELFDAVADLVSVQALAGHSSPAITARCDRRAERALLRAAMLLNLPVRVEALKHGV